MKAKFKFGGSVLAAFMAFFAAMMCFISLPLVSNAETGTLGTESPEIYCTYAQDGVAVDGNELTAGTYDVSFVVSGVKSLSVVQITAAYDESKVTVASAPSYSISDDENMALDSIGYVLSGGNIVFGFVSENDDCSAISEKKQIIVTLSVTFAEDCDAADYITVSTNPNLTFLQVDYGDGYNDEYALVDSYDDYDGVLYLMTCDVTPDFGYNITGEIVIMTNQNDVTNGTPAYGTYTVDVYADADRTDLVTSVTTVSETNENNETKNMFNIRGLLNGRYYATISSEYAIPRNVEIVVSGSDIDAGMIPMICCDFDKDSLISSADAKIVYTSIVNENLKDYCELDGDGVVASADAKIVYQFVTSYSYNSLTIE